MLLQALCRLSDVKLVCCGNHCGLSSDYGVEMNDHNRFDEEHRKTCDSCHDAYNDFIQESNDEARLDELSEGEEDE